MGRAYSRIPTKSQNSDVTQAIIDQTNMALRVIEASGGITYIGKAAIGASETDAVWSIKQIIDHSTIEDDSTNIEILYANGTADFIHSWVDRETYSYS
ncbi:MAG: hypothetical protein BroJett025_02680 [Patescibacteria group bacterium]|nr:MAG: hypothetical protein BroJett025_02680 [Patescibacteria group bacterium]